MLSGLFPAHVRYTGISVVYQFPSFLVAGIVPALCTYLLKLNHGAPYYICYFVMFVALVGAWSAWTIQKRTDLGRNN
jgi:VIT1/CCC1 family predicted Fe2+/Mn2+ transporter